MSIQIGSINPFINSQGVQAAPAVKRQVGGNVQFGTLTAPVTSFRETTANNQMFAGKTAGINENIKSDDVIYLAPQAGKAAGISTRNFIA